VVQPRHRHNPRPLPRWTRMLAAPSRAWSVFKQIFADHWEAFQHAHPRYRTAYYDVLVAKMLACGNPDQMVYIEYRCLKKPTPERNAGGGCGSTRHLSDRSLILQMMITIKRRNRCAW
jgi:hypothetical protein